MTLEPEAFHLALHVRMRVMLTVIGNRLDLCRREGELTHGHYSQSCFILIPTANLGIFKVRGNHANSGRAEYTCGRAMNRSCIIDALLPESGAG